MSQQRAKVSAVVVDRGGLRGTFDPSADVLEGGRVLVRLEDGRQALVPADELIMHDDGSFALPFSFAELSEPRGPSDGEERAAPARAGAGGEPVVVPVIAEQLEVSKRKVESGGVRVRKVVREREEVVDEPLVREEVSVRRVPVNRVVEEPPPVRRVGDTLVIPLLEEVLVVEKRLLVREELHVTKSEVETRETRRVLLRSEEAHVERVGEEGQTRSGGGAGERRGA